MGIEAVYPKPKLSQPGEGHKIYPYLLRGVTVERVNQVWSTDITYIRMAQGFVYLVAVMDWFSRFVLSWSLSLTMEVDFCMEALKRALRRGRPEIFNSDQGSQFTSEKFTGELAARQIAISMDGRGRCMDNIFIERLWRSLKYEEVYLKDYESVTEARAGHRTLLSGSTTTSGCTRASTTGRRRRSTWDEASGDDRPTKKEGHPTSGVGGTLSPNPWDLTLWGQNGLVYNEGT